MREALAVVEGTYGIAVLHADFPDRIVVARNGSPLILGIGEKEMFVASDVAALVRYTRQVVAPRRRRAGHAHGRRLHDLSPTDRSATHEGRDRPSSRTPAAYDTGGHDALHAQGDPRAARRPPSACCAAGSTSGSPPRTSAASTWTPREPRGDPPGQDPRLRLGVLRRADRRRADRGAGPDPRRRRGRPASSATATRSSSPTPCTSRSASPARPTTRCSPSRRSSARAAGSSAWSTSSARAIARECDGGIYLHAGPEVAVASTKALTNMSVAFALLALHLGRVRDLSVADGQRIIDGPARLPDQIARGPRAEEELIASWPRSYAEAESLFFVGRVRGYPVAREGAQKLKEISYLHAEAYPASELKHGPLALIDPSGADRRDRPRRRADRAQPRRPGRDQGRAARSARGGHPRGVDLEKCRPDRIDVPANEPELDPILMTIPLQLLAYHAALALGRDIDKPRNLAKSVTVE